MDTLPSPQKYTPSEVMLYAHDPGGANALVPIMNVLVNSLNTLGQRDVNIHVYADGPAVSVFKHAGYTPISLKSMGLSDINWIGNWFAEQSFSAVITGTSANDMTEKYLWHAARQQGCLSVAVLDQWVNYGIRFADVGLNQNAAYLNSPTHPYLPDMLAVMDETAKNELLEAVPEFKTPSQLFANYDERVWVTGQPHFSTVIQEIHNTNTTAIKSRLQINTNEHVAVFASEPFSETYKNKPPYGFSEYSIAESLLEEIQRLSPSIQQSWRVILKLHPKESIDKYAKLLTQIKLPSDSPVQVQVIQEECTSRELIAIADVVMGMASMMLLEGALANKPVVSFQMGLNVEKNPLVLCRHGVMNPVIKTSTFTHDCQQIFVNGTLERFKPQGFFPKVDGAQVLTQQIQVLLTDSKVIKQKETRP